VNQSHAALKYDAWNRMVEFKQGSLGHGFEYDGLNRLIVRTLPAVSTNYHSYYNEDWQVLVETEDPSSATLTPTAMYAYHTNYVDAVANRMRPSDSHVYLQDANYNVTALLEPDSTVVERYSYTPYGEIAYLDASFAALGTQASAIGNEIFYTGRERDPETGLQLNRNRWYHAPLGRWVSRDPILYEGGTMNLYEYVGDSPTTFADPNGFCRDTEGYDACLESADKRHELCKHLGRSRLCDAFKAFDYAKCYSENCDDPDEPEQPGEWIKIYPTEDGIVCETIPYSQLPPEFRKPFVPNEGLEPMPQPKPWWQNPIYGIYPTPISVLPAAGSTVPVILPITRPITQPVNPITNPITKPGIIRPAA
jgi:RHS repeat-associated protein